MEVKAQDLDPRAYSWLPEKTTTLFSGISYSWGDVLTEPSVSLQDVQADVEVAMLGVMRSFNISKFNSQLVVALPYAWAQASGKLNEQRNSITRSGFADMRIRWSVMFLGNPVQGSNLAANKKRKTVVGASLTLSAPTGQFYPNKLINIGVNRWSVRPEIGISQPIGKHFLFDLYAGVWFFTDNKVFFPGDATRSQKPLGTFQSHISYNIKPGFWVALDGTYYTGGTSSVDDVFNDDRQSNTRFGITAAVPLGRMNFIKISGSTGAVVRVGQDFNLVSIGWSKTWINKAPSTKD